MKLLKGKASEILYDMLEGIYTVEHKEDDVHFIEVETGTEFLVDDDVKYYLRLMEQQD